jgi:hypothetical protein
MMHAELNEQSGCGLMNKTEENYLSINNNWGDLWKELSNHLSGWRRGKVMRRDFEQLFWFFKDQTQKNSPRNGWENKSNIIHLSTSSLIDVSSTGGKCFFSHFHFLQFSSSKIVFLLRLKWLQNYSALNKTISCG